MSFFENIMNTLKCQAVHLFFLCTSELFHCLSSDRWHGSES